MKPRKLIVKDVEYRYLVSAPCEDYGIVRLRIFIGSNKIPLLNVPLRQQYLPVTPGFVTAQIEYATTPLIFSRASGDCVCVKCGKNYYDHPMDGPFLGDYWDCYQWLRRTCAGELVKL